MLTRYKIFTVHDYLQLRYSRRIFIENIIFILNIRSLLSFSLVKCRSYNYNDFHHRPFAFNYTLSSSVKRKRNNAPAPSIFVSEKIICKAYVALSRAGTSDDSSPSSISITALRLKSNEIMLGNIHIYLHT